MKLRPEDRHRCVSGLEVLPVNLTVYIQFDPFDVMVSIIGCRTLPTLTL
jgi:hypothetical protein